jgi:hypothetical protein
MEVSKLIISGETLRAHSATLTKKRKTELRKEAIKAYINSKPAGAVIKSSAFMSVGAFNSEANAHAHILRMIRDGEIGRQHPEGHKRYYSYWVNDSPASSDNSEDTQMPIEEEVHAEEVLNAVDIESAKAEAKPAEDYAPHTESFDYEKIRHDVSLKIAAKDFAWKNNSDSLRAFIDWYVR